MVQLQVFLLPFLSITSHKSFSVEFTLLRVIYSIFAILLPICLIVYTFHFPIINSILGPSWSQYSLIFAVLSPLILLLPLIATLKTFLYSVSANKVVSISYLLGSGIFLVVLFQGFTSSFSLYASIILIIGHLVVVFSFLSLYNFNFIFKVRLLFLLLFVLPVLYSLSLISFWLSLVLCLFVSLICSYFALNRKSFSFIISDCLLDISI